MEIVLQFTAFLLPVSAHESKVLWLFLHKVDVCSIFACRFRLNTWSVLDVSECPSPE